MPTNFSKVNFNFIYLLFGMALSCKLNCILGYKISQLVRHIIGRYKITQIRLASSINLNKLKVMILARFIQINLKKLVCHLPQQYRKP